MELIKWVDRVSIYQSVTRPDFLCLLDQRQLLRYNSVLFSRLSHVVYLMTPRGSLALAFFLASGTLMSLPAQTLIMPLEVVTPGMIGTGVTVFAGSERTEFTAEILGVLENSMGPRRNLILARLTGGPLSDSGVIQGMSGSPVYVENRLIGAVSYSMGSFSKDTLAGITPIAEMLNADTAPEIQLERLRPAVSLPFSIDTLTSLTSNQFPKVSSFTPSRGTLAALDLPVASLASHLEPIATPIVTTGFSPETLGQLAPIFERAELAPVPATTTGNQSSLGSMPLLQPGDPLGVGLIQGDLLMAGTGTVTHIEAGRVYAFGHQFYNLGPSQFPMTRAYVHAILPSLLASSRITSIGETLGTIDQDRSTGVSGRFGPGPSLVPVNVQLLSPERDRIETFDFAIIRDDLFTPFLTYTAILNTILSHSRQVGAASYSVKGQIELADHPPVNFQESVAGDSAAPLAALYASGPLSALLNNEFEPLTITNLAVSITAHDQIRAVTLNRVWLDSPRPRPGQTVPLHLAFRDYRGDEILRTVMMDLPQTTSDRLELVVADGMTLAQEERLLTRQSSRPANIQQLIDALNDARRNSHVYIQLSKPDTGAVVNGQRLPSLPPSILGVLGNAQRAGTFARLDKVKLREWSLSLDDSVVSGSRRLSIELDTW